MQKRVYAVMYAGYTYAPGSVSDWVIGDNQTKNIMADSSLQAVDYLRNSERNRIEVQRVTLLCNIDMIAEVK